MRVGVQIVALVNDVASIVNMFYPVVLGKVVPVRLVVKAQQYVNSLSKLSSVEDYGVLQNAVSRNSDGKAKRGAALREFLEYLKV